MLSSEKPDFYIIILTQQPTIIKNETVLENRVYSFTLNILFEI